ncbi:MAG: PDZ domain-containing protein [Planctomycetota bacterium]
MPGGAAHRCGLREGDRIVGIDGARVDDTLSHDRVVALIRDGGDAVRFTVVDRRHDEREAGGSGGERRALLFKLRRRADAGFGIYIWYDEDGHFVKRVTAGSAADAVGLRVGDRIVAVNGLDVARWTHARIFERIKSSGRRLTLLAVDHKTFLHCRRHRRDVASLATETRATPGYEDAEPTPSDDDGEVPRVASPDDYVEHDVTLYSDARWPGFGFHLACASSFMTSSESRGSRHVVHWVGESGPADEVGLRDGDQIVSVSQRFCVWMSSTR